MSPVRVFAVSLRAGLPVDVARTASGVAQSTHVSTVDAVADFSRFTGSPRTLALLALADALDDSEERDRDITVGMASTTATTRILLALPGITAVAAEMFGFTVVTFLLTTPLGIACLGAGSLLVVAAWRWMGALRRKIPHPPAETGLVLDLAAALCRSSSLGPEQRSSLVELAIKWNTLDELNLLDGAVRLSRTHGVPVSQLLHIEAERRRTEARHSVRYAIELLPTALLAPVGTLLLPAFVVTTVVPVVVSLAQEFFLS